MFGNPIQYFGKGSSNLQTNNLNNIYMQNNFMQNNYNQNNLNPFINFGNVNNLQNPPITKRGPN